MIFVQKIKKNLFFIISKNAKITALSTFLLVKIEIKNHTLVMEVGTHLRISFWDLWMKMKNYLLK